MNRHFHIRNYFTSAQRLVKLQTITEFSNGRKLVLESGSLAKLADGSAVATIGNTSVLVTCVSKPRPGPPAAFMPLTVDYRQKYAAAGRIPSNYLRRELAPTEKEILTSRVIDRSVRPLFPSGYLHDTQLTCQLLAVDGMQEPDVVSINAASASLAISNIPWEGPTGAVRVGVIDGETILFPTRRELLNSDLNLIITASDHNEVVMLEGSGTPVLLQDLRKAIKFGVKECQKIIQSIRLLAKQNNTVKREFVPPVVASEELLTAARSLCETRLNEIFSDFTHDKLSRDIAVNNLRLDVIKKLAESFCETDSSLLNDAFNSISKETFRNLILEKGIRCDGRGLKDLRPISCSIDLFQPLHGSSLFQRGQTQVQCTVAFDSPDKSLSVDPLLELTGGVKGKNFILHYSFPSYANNELSRGGPLSRREVGHGALAAKGLMPILPKGLPFTVLLTSTVMESNGSSSMATVCGGSLALMDAGVEVTSPAAGVAIGLVSKSDEKGKFENHRLLTDILGIEDYLGDMDFKIAGTKHGITALQADIKLKGLPLKIIMEAIDEAYIAKNSILDIMNATIAETRKDKENLPVVFNKEIPLHRRGAVMGAGGVNIKRIQAESGVQITWLESGNLSLFAPNRDALDEAVHFIDEFLQSEPDLEFGGIYTANIVEIRSQGVMVTLYEGMTPVLLHNSQLDVKKVLHPSVLCLEVGQQLKVKYFGRDPTSGHMRLSRRALQATSSAIKNLHTNGS